MPRIPAAGTMRPEEAGEPRPLLRFPGVSVLIKLFSEPSADPGVMVGKTRCVTREASPMPPFWDHRVVEVETALSREGGGLVLRAL